MAPCKCKSMIIKMDPCKCKSMIVIVIMFMLIMITTSSATDHDQRALPGCSSRCGGIDIPYPFGTTKECSLNKNFLIKCTNNSTPILGKNLVVTNISIQNHEMTILWSVARDCYNGTSGQQVSINRPTIRIPTLTISSSKNKFTVIGCDSYAYLRGYDNGSAYSMGCMSICSSKDDVPNDMSCSGIGCCQIDIPKGLNRARISPRSYKNHTDVIEFNPCTYAFVVEESQFSFSPDFLANYSEKMLPLVVEWAIEKNDTYCHHSHDMSFCPCSGPNTRHQATSDDLRFNCVCAPGYQGNPYLPDGCSIDIDECYSDLDNCSDDEYCENTIGSFICKERHRELPLVKIIIGR
ncbi:Wall-associated receptor kinase [Parasponia andersonii]|uniref:Wall-associated receptor kinase n=1 Tax=Parasponia andersonii TaxID=3476 RepID=A0A2P5DWL1_PARAD|nr:Wall-associated receptor kinase [Parasponia andersonii]